MHGILTALRSCLPACDISPKFVERLNQMLTKSTRTMLGLLSGRRKDGEELVNASFADMGVAIDTLLRGENLEDDDEDCLAGLAEAIKMSLPFLLKILFVGTH
jgi:hypothetical protein